MATFSNGESGLSVRNKINEAINKVDGAAAISSINIDGGTIDGTVIGGNTPAAGTFTAVGADALDLDAIAATKAVTAVDVFVYDTSKDSDGGAWRKRTQHTSWYNETLNTATRGSRREFPAVAVIVAEATKVTIYDGDDPALPMWITFPAAGSNFFREPTCLAMVNGLLAVGANVSGALSVMDFASDRGEVNFGSVVDVRVWGSVSETRDSSAFVPDPTIPVIVSRNVNDVAMTVLPDAPIDPATGLPVPTIAVATQGGVSVIKDDGTVVDITGYVYAPTKIAIEGNTLWNSHTTSDGALYAGPLVFNADTTLTSWRYAYYNKTVAAALSTLDVDSLSIPAVGGANGISLLAENPTTPANGMVAYTTSTYNTGWMNGDIKGAFLSSTDATSLVGSGELVTNGDFATNDLTGWTDISLGTGTANASTGAARLTGTDTSNRGWVNTSFSTVAGKPYVVTFEVTADAGGLVSLGVGPTSSSVSILDVGVSSVGTYTRTFVATTTTTHVNFRTSGVTDMTIDNISVKLADADRSVNNKGLIVNGTVTRSPVATGADLVGYSGGGANFLSRDFAGAYTGHSSFALIGWYFGGTTGFWDWYETVGGGTSATFLDTYMDFTTKSFRLVWQGRASIIVQGDGPSIEGRWAQIALCFTGGGGLQFYQDGRLIKTYANVPSAALHELRVLPGGGSRMALLRLSATAPSSDQIRRIYEDEKMLFQENAACTLYGASDSVTALAHDSDTGLLHVGTSAGRSVFQGLRRVSNTTTAVGTAISASGGLVVEE